MPQYVYHKAHDMLKKPRRNSAVLSWIGGTKTIFTEFVCLELDGIEETIMEYGKFALEDHSYTATREERRRNENSWKLSWNAEGANGPMDQRDVSKEAKEIYERPYRANREITGCGNTPIFR